MNNAGISDPDWWGVALTRALALDGKRVGIRLNAVCPRGTTAFVDAGGLVTALRPAS
jgi:hypothetical protein